METNKRKVLVVQGLHEQGIKMLDKRSDIEYQVLMSDDENEISNAAKDVHGITVRTANITQKIIESAKNLLVVSRHGVGYDSIDTKTLSEKKNSSYHCGSFKHDFRCGTCNVFSISFV